MGALKAGAAKADITASGEGVAVKDPLYARVLLLDNGDERAVIIGMDTTAIGGRKISRGALNDVGEEFLPVLRERIERELGIPGSGVLVNASHTHPPGKLLCDDGEQVRRVFEAVKRARDGMTEARAGSGIGREDRITMNRTLRLKDGKHWTIRHTNPCPPDDEVAGLGPVDFDIGVLRVDRIDGSPLAAVFNFACHPLAGIAGGGISAYLPGFACGVIEYELGGGAEAVFLQGAGGDVIDVLFKDVNYISSVLHRAYIDVEEKGTEAAAATAVVMRIVSVRPRKIFMADRPFMFIIRETETGNILFLGRVSNPGGQQP